MGNKLKVADNEVLIQYIGLQPCKDDNVMDSGRRWERPGAALPIPRDQKYHYLKHPSVWREVTAEQLAAEDTSQRDLVASVSVCLSSIELEGLREIELAVQLQIEQAQLEQQKLADIEPPPAPEDPVPLDGANAADFNDVGTMAATDARQKKIIAVLRDMDPEVEPESFRADGKTPLMDVVRNRSGYADVGFDEMMGLLATIK